MVFWIIFFFLTLAKHLFFYSNQKTKMSRYSKQKCRQQKCWLIANGATLFLVCEAPDFGKVHIILCLIEYTALHIMHITHMCLQIILRPYKCMVHSPKVNPRAFMVTNNEKVPKNLCYGCLAMGSSKVGSCLFRTISGGLW